MKTLVLTYKKQLLLCLGICMIALSATVTYFVAQPSAAEKQFQNNPEVLAATDVVPSNPDLENRDTFAVLLLGYGGAGHQGGFLADTIQVAYFDFKAETISFIAIPRDLEVALPNGTEAKINRAFSLGTSDDPIHSGAQIAADMASVVTGIPIDSFVSVDFVGFKRAIGGPLDAIEVSVSETLDDPWYPIQGEELNPCGKTPEEIADLTNTLSGFELEKQFECRYEHIYYEPGLHTMEGGEALAFVRSRHGSAGGDFSRSKRQQEVLLAIRDKLFTLEALTKIPEFYKDMITHTDTDLTIQDITTLAPQLATTQNMKTKSINLSTENVLQNGRSNAGAFIVLPKAGKNNWTQTRAFVSKELGLE